MDRTMRPDSFGGSSTTSTAFYRDGRPRRPRAGRHLRRSRAGVAGAAAPLPGAPAPAGPLARGRRPGDFFTYDLSGVPILVTRAPLGRLHALLNCAATAAQRSRPAPAADGIASPVLTMPGRTTAKGVCAAWAPAGLRGDGSRQPRPYAATGGRTARLDLGAAQPRRAARPRRAPRGAWADLAGYGWAQYHHHETRVLRRQRNWKLAVDTFLESWHVPVLHRQTVSRVLHGSAAAVHQFGQTCAWSFPSDHRHAAGRARGGVEPRPPRAHDLRALPQYRHHHGERSPGDVAHLPGQHPGESVTSSRSTPPRRPRATVPGGVAARARDAPRHRERRDFLSSKTSSGG